MYIFMEFRIKKSIKNRWINFVATQRDKNS